MTSGSATRLSVPIVIGCDTDPDRETFVGPMRANQLEWRGLSEGIPALKRAVERVVDSAGSPPRFTWLLRSDEQVRTVHGDDAWSYTQHRALLDSLRAAGDELGWHPHFWRQAPDGRWHQDARDEAWQLAMLEQSHASLVRAGVTPTSVRMGWTFHTNATMATLARLGVRIDFSALPGLRTIHVVPPAERSENLYDWFDAPARSYRPSRDNYQRAATGSDALGILELPSFVARSRFWGGIAGLQLARKTRELGPLADAIVRPRFVANITARPTLFAPLVRGLAAAIRRAKNGAGERPAFATYFHPDELLANRSGVYALEHVATNLNALNSAIASEGADSVFLTATTFADRFGADSFATA